MADHLHDLAALYAVGALEPEEERAFETHLDGCEACQRELTQARDGIAAVALDAAEEPPAEMRRAVMARIDAEPVPTPIRSARIWQGVAAVAAVVAVAMTLLWVGSRSELGRVEQLEEVLAAADLQTVEVADSPVGPIRFVYSPELGRGVLTGDGLEPIPDDRTYQLWLIDDDGPASAGTFRPDAEGDALVVVEDIRPGVTLGLTVEPAGGSPQPTGDVLVAEPLT